jgi:branched-chain amino acid transport system permease protein
VDLLLSGQLLAAALISGSLYALIALGLNLVYGTMRLLNIAHGDLVMIGAYVAFWCFALIGIGPLISGVAAVVLTAALGALIYHGLFRRVLRSSHLLERLEANSLLLFFGVSVIIQNVAALAFTASPRAYRYLDGIVHIGDASVTESRLAMFAVATVVCAGFVLFLRWSVFGLAMRALIQSRDASAIVGINLDRVQLVTFCVGFGVAGLAGALLSMTEQISPFMGFPYTIAAFVVIILGGLGNLAGGIIAGLILGFLDTYGVALTSPNYRSVVIYGVFVLILVMRPQGLLGKPRIAR